MEELNKILEHTKKRCFCVYCITTPIIPEIELIQEIPKPEVEEALFICPTCFNKSMKFLDDNTQECTKCGTKGYFTKDPEKGEIVLK